MYSVLRLAIAIASLVVGVGASRARAQQVPSFNGQSLQSWPLEIVEAHNAVRAQTGVPPLAWSDEVAAYTQQWAAFLASQPTIFHRPHNRYGENIFWTSGSATAEFVVQQWTGESKYYDYGNNSCAGVCGHLYPGHMVEYAGGWMRGS